MNVDKNDMLLYLVTDRRWLVDETLSQVVEKAAKNNVTFIQLREKDLDEAEFKQLALEVKKITDQYEIPFVINDNIDVALAIDADGVHIGQQDLEVSKARERLGPNKILGVSAATVEEAIKAQEAGADYLGIGAVFTTPTKEDARSIALDEIKKITKAVKIPMVGIGGIEKGNIHHLKDSGLNGVAVISAILGQQDIEQATKNLYGLAKELFDASCNI